jgi:hypothetical protein
MRRRVVIDDDQEAAEPIEEGTAGSGISERGIDENGINVEALSKIAGRLPCADEFEALDILARMREALRAFIETYRENRAEPRPTVGTVRDDLRRLDQALAELNEAWAAMSGRTSRGLAEAAGQAPFGELERRPLVAMPDVWARGAFRVVNFRRAVDQITEAISATRAAANKADQDRRAPVPGLETLTDRLAAIFTECTGRQLSTSRKSTGAVGWMQQVVETLPRQYRPSADAVTWAVRRATTRSSRK